MKIVVDVKSEGFLLSEKALATLSKKKGVAVRNGFYFIANRHDKDLVAVVEKLGKDASHGKSLLEVVNVKKYWK